MSEGKKILISALLIFILFLGAGKILFDKKSLREDQVDGFFDALTNQKSLNYFSKVKNLLKDYKCMEIELSGQYTRKIFYKLADGKPKKTDNQCASDIIIKMNDHSVAGLIYGSYNINGAFLSEYITGNLKIEGVGFGGFFKLI